jgi:ribosome maturation factor RimP
MPMPTEDRVSELIAASIQGRGYDLEGVRVTAAGSKSVVRVMVDADAGVDLDAVAELSRDLSDLLDDAGDFGHTPYTLEVTTPGIDRPLSAERHWRRARGRKVRIVTANGELIGRVGELNDGEVAIVIRGRSGPSLEHVELAEVREAVVQVEFSPPDPRELALAGGVAEGRPEPGADPDSGADADMNGENAEEHGQ